jgi:hypothetical protein
MDQLHVTLVCSQPQGSVLFDAVAKVTKRTDLITHFGDYPNFRSPTSPIDPKKAVREADILIFTVRLMSHNRDRKPFDGDGQYHDAGRYWKRADGTSPLIVVMYLCESFDEGRGDKITHRIPPIDPDMRQEMSGVDYYWFNLELGKKGAIDLNAFTRRLTAAAVAGGLFKA